MSDLYWLTDAQMARLELFFPTSHAVPGRRVLSGIIFINRNGLRRRDAPAEFGPPKALYSRWKRCSDNGIFARPKDWRRAARAVTDVRKFSCPPARCRRRPCSGSEA